MTNTEPNPGRPGGYVTADETAAHLAERADRDAMNEAIADEDAHRVYDQLDAAVESLVTSVTLLAGLGVATRAQERHLRRVQREMAAADERAAGDGAA